jgi:ribose 5-phosphate isomerase B
LSEKIYVGADHAGFDLKQQLVAELKKLGYEPIDVGPKSLDPNDDYPDYAKPVAEAVSKGKAQRGILTCGTGLGMAYVANRYPKVRAAVVWSPEIAELSRTHNDANVLVLPSRFVSEKEGLEILHTWLDTKFEGGRHQRRVEKIEK